MMELERLVIFVPAFNEENSIAGVVKSIPRKVAGLKKVLVLIVNDGSTDNTAAIASNAGADRICPHKTNLGLGRAFKTGIDEALKMGADCIITIDADGQFNAADIPKLLEPILDGRAEKVTCSRFKDSRLVPDMPWIKKFGNGIFTGIVNALTGKKFTDTQCGFRAYSKEAALRLNTFGKHTYTQEVFLGLAAAGLAIEEVALPVRGEREHGESKVVSNVFVYGMNALLIIIRAVRDYKPLLFFGGIGAAIFYFGFMIAFAIFVRWLLTGMTSPFTSLIAVSGVIMIIGFLLLMLALIADMQGRQRRVQEEILYRLKKQELEKVGK